MPLRKIECFIAVARQRSFVRAAELLHLSPSGVSESIKSLELDVGGRLFERTSRRVALTPLGEQLLADAEPAVIDLHAALEAARARAKGATETLTIGYLGGGFYGLTAPLMSELARVRPALAVRLREVSYVDQVDAVLNGEVDAVMMRLPVEHPELERGAVLLSGPRVLCVPSGHRLAGRAVVDPEELAGETFLRLPQGAATPTWRSFHFPTSTPSGRRIADGAVIQTVREGLAAVAAGLGVFGLTKEARNYYTHPGVEFVDIDLPPVRSAIVYRARDRRALLTDLEEAARTVAASAGTLEPMPELRIAS